MYFVLFGGESMLSCRVEPSGRRRCHQLAKQSLPSFQFRELRRAQTSQKCLFTLQEIRDCGPTTTRSVGRKGIQVMERSSVSPLFLSSSSLSVVTVCCIRFCAAEGSPMGQPDQPGAVASDGDGSSNSWESSDTRSWCGFGLTAHV